MTSFENTPDESSSAAAGRLIQTEIRELSG